MELYLMQHGASLSRELDPEQSLSPMGGESIQKSARAMRVLGISLDVIVASPKKRAMETALIVARELNYPKNKIISTELVKAMTEPNKTLEYLHTLEDAESVLIAGHLPHLAELAGKMISRGDKSSISFTNGGLVRLDVDTFLPPAATLAWSLSQFQTQLLSNA